MKRNKESKARVRIFSQLGLNKSEQMQVDRYLKRHNSNYCALYKKFKVFNEILMTAADFGTRTDTSGCIIAMRIGEKIIFRICQLALSEEHFPNLKNRVLL